jgi:hypothetical protein
MTLLPVVTRELLVQARRPATYRTRMLTALVLGGVAILIMLVARQNRSMPQMVFWLNSSLALGWCLISGAILTSDCLGGEQREGTLGLLFLTDLRSVDIVLGKLAATSLQAGFGLLAMLPILAWPLLLGGVTSGQFWRLTLVLLVTQFASLSIGALVSSITLSARTAVSRVLAILVLQTAGISLLAWLLGRIPLQAAMVWARIVGTLNPLQAFDDAMTRHMAGATTTPWFGRGVGVLFLTGLICIFLASLRLPRLLHRSVSPDLPSRNCAPARLADFGTGNPYATLVLRHPGRDVLTWILIGIGTVWLGFYAAAWMESRTGAPQFFIVAFLMAYGIHALVKIRWMLEVTRQPCDHAASGGLELVLSTPLPPAAIVDGAVFAFWQRACPSLLVLTAMNLLLWILIFREPLQINGHASVAFSLIFLGGGALLWMDAAALVPLGLLNALRYRRQLKATVTTAAWVFVPGWLGALLLFLIMSRGMSSSGSIPYPFGIWILGNAAIALLIRGISRAELRAFRALAAGEPRDERDRWLLSQIQSKTRAE